MSDEYWEIDYSPPARAGRYDPIADHGRERPGYRVRWIAGTTDYEWVPVEPLYRIVWFGNLEADADVALTWPRLLYALRQYVPHTTKRLSAHVARVERVAPDA
jgi:hypothetical protein